MADNYTTARKNSPLAFGEDAIPYTPADADLVPGVKGVVFDAAGTISFKNAAGTTRTGYPVAAGTVLPFIPARILSMSGPSTCHLIV